MNKPLATVPQNSAHLLSGLPDGWAIEQIAYVSQPTADADVVYRFPASIALSAVRLSDDADRSTVAEQTLGPVLLTIPVDVPWTLKDTQNSWMETMQSWVDEGQSTADASHMMTFQGVLIYWSMTRIAVLAPSQRMAAIRQALIEASYYQAELCKVEEELGQNWPMLQADMPLAFEFNQQSIPKRRLLRERFQQILQQQAHMARIGPFIHAAHTYPPTLASQISERLRERTRMMHRHEFLGEQLDVFHSVYESCAQRSSEFMLARTGHLLEWAIIVILLVQTLFLVIEMLAGTGV